MLWVVFALLQAEERKLRSNGRCTDLNPGLGKSWRFCSALYLPSEGSGRSWSTKADTFPRIDDLQAPVPFRCVGDSSLILQCRLIVLDWPSQVLNS